MISHPKLRQVADKALAAFSEYDMYCRWQGSIYGEAAKSEWAGLLTKARQEWFTARQELLEALGGEARK